MHGCFSDMGPVTCGLSQGLIMDPLLFVIYIKELEENVSGMIGKKCRLHQNC